MKKQNNGFLEDERNSPQKNDDFNPQTSINSKKLPVQYHLASSIASRIVVSSMLYPIDFVKTRLQYSHKGLSESVYKNGFDVIRQVTKNEGFLAVYSGLGIRLIYTIPSAAVSFALYEQVKGLISNMIKKKNMEGMNVLFLSLFAGVSARSIGSLIRTPFDLIRLNLQVQGITNNNLSELSLIDKFKYSLRQSNFFDGYKITLLRDLPFACAYFTSYEIGKSILKKYLTNKDPQQLKDLRKKPFSSDFIHLCAGAYAGIVSTTLTIPMDVVKTRLQIETPGQQKASISNTFKTIYREEGPSAFVKGLGTRVMYLIPSASLTFMFYERFKAYFIERHNKECHV